jgi:hypothetical protein
MKVNHHTIRNLLILTAALLAAGSARAVNYSTNDVLLILRSPGFNDVEFDLGNISQFLNHPSGYTVAVTNWNPAVVNANYALNGGDVQFALLASTSISDPNPNSWVTDAQPLQPVSDVTLSKWRSGLALPINGVGNGIAADPLAPANTNYDALVPSSSYSFDQVTSNNGNNPAAIPYLGGSAGISFEVIGGVPGTLLFYQLAPSSVTPKPAGTLIGSFSLDVNGHLTFQAGPLLDSANITSVNTGGGLVAVAFNSKAAVKYRLRYSPSLATPVSSWTILPNPLAGDGTPQVLNATLPAAAAGFYAVESYP